MLIVPRCNQGLRVVGIGVFFILIAGYGGPKADYSKVSLVQVGGTVTLDGIPLADAVVTFEDENGQFSYALTDAAGRSRLRFDSVMNGVTPGPKLVRISTARRIPGLNDAGGGEAGEERGNRGPALVSALQRQPGGCVLVESAGRARGAGPRLRGLSVHPRCGVGGSDLHRRRALDPTGTRPLAA